MRHVKSCPLLMAAALLYPYPSSAQTLLDPVVVTANRVETPLSQVGSSVTILDRAEIERLGQPSLIDLLKRVPGLSISRNGGLGATSAVRIRGADSGQTLVLIDGVRMNDAAATGGEFDFATVAAADIERIEVLRGPQSALYGNDAMGGVINIITKRGTAQTGQRPFTATGSLEGGSYGTFRQQAGISGGLNGIDYALSADHLKTDGFNRIRRGSERDGAEDWAVNGRIGAQLLPNWRIGASAGYADLDSDFDPGARQDGPAIAETTQRFARAETSLGLFDGFLTNSLSLGWSQVSRDYDEPLGYFRRSAYEGTTVMAEYQGTLAFNKTDSLTIGAAARQDSAESSNSRTPTAFDQSVWTRSVFAQAVLNPLEPLFLTIGTRLDDHETFGGKATWRLTGAYLIDATETTLRASYGTGSKAPSLFQLFDPLYGNPRLTVETSRGYDIGVEQKIGGTLTLGLTWFHNRFEDLIQYTGSGYTNIGKARTQGVEATARWSPLSVLSFGADYTYLNAEDEATGRELPRRPEHTLILRADWQAMPDLSLGVSSRTVSSQRDTSFSTRRSPASTGIDLHATYRLAPWISLFGRAENLTDADIRDAADYRATGRAIYLGVRATY